MISHIKLELKTTSGAGRGQCSGKSLEVLEKLSPSRNEAPGESKCFSRKPGRGLMVPSNRKHLLN